MSGSHFENPEAPEAEPNVRADSAALAKDAFAEEALLVLAKHQPRQSRGAYREDHSCLNCFGGRADYDWKNGWGNTLNVVSGFVRGRYSP